VLTFANTGFVLGFFTTVLIQTTRCP